MSQAAAVKPGLYRHTKSGKHYTVIGTAAHSETGELSVVYKPEYVHDFEFDFFIRPVDMFIEQIELDGAMRPRFEHISS